MSSDDSYSDGENLANSNPRLNMKHGFLHHIRNNQISRDNYDRKMKQKGTTTRKSKQSTEHKKQLYIPPNLQKAQNSVNKKILFNLEYTTEAGRIYNVPVREGENPNTVARKLQQDAGIPPDLIKTLAWKIEHELNENGL